MNLIEDLRSAHTETVSPPGMNVVYRDPSGLEQQRFTLLSDIIAQGVGLRWYQVRGGVKAVNFVAVRGPAPADIWFGTVSEGDAGYLLSHSLSHIFDQPEAKAAFLGGKASQADCFTNLASTQYNTAEAWEAAERRRELAQAHPKLFSS